MAFQRLLNDVQAVLLVGAVLVRGASVSGFLKKPAPKVQEARVQKIFLAVDLYSVVFWRNPITSAMK